MTRDKIIYITTNGLEQIALLKQRYYITALTPAHIIQKEEEDENKDAHPPTNPHTILLWYLIYHQ